MKGLRGAGCNDTYDVGWVTMINMFVIGIARSLAVCGDGDKECNGITESS
jgi:hypothetical protein